MDTSIKREENTPSATQKSSLNSIRDLLKRNALRLTPQRVLLLSLIQSSGKHLDADQLYELARQQGSKIGRATVYRNLKRLVEAGVLRQRFFEEPPIRSYYEMATPAEHYHFTCLRCGKIIEFACPEIEEVTQRLYHTYGIVVSHGNVILSGYCATCLREIEKGVENQVGENVLSLAKLSPGQSGIIVHVGGEGRLRRRFMEMGLIKGERITVERLAPLGDPMEFIVKGYHLSLRQNEAALIQVELTSA